MSIEDLQPRSEILPEADIEALYIELRDFIISSSRVVQADIEGAIGVATRAPQEWFITLHRDQLKEFGVIGWSRVILKYSEEHYYPDPDDSEVRPPRVSLTFRRATSGQVTIENDVDIAYEAAHMPGYQYEGSVLTKDCQNEVSSYGEGTIRDITQQDLEYFMPTLGNIVSD